MQNKYYQKLYIFVGFICRCMWFGASNFSNGDAPIFIRCIYKSMKKGRIYLE